MTPARFEARLREMLDPLDSWDGAAPAPRSDFDLNPGFQPNEARRLKPAAVLVPVVMHEAGPSVLLTRRADTLNSHTGQVAFPGGRLDPGEGVVEAAMREAWEEVGLTADRIRPLGLSDGYETGSAFCVTPVVALVEPGFDLTLSPDEVAEAFEVPWSFLMDPINHRHDSMVWHGAERWFWAMPWDDAGTERYIWGATAGMIRSLQQRWASAGEAMA